MRVPISEWRFSPQVTIVSMRWSRYRPNESHPFLLTANYASPNFSKRKILWNYLKNFASSVDLPWILLGDFNDMLEENDKIGELPFNGNSSLQGVCWVDTEPMVGKVQTFVAH